ncbi:MAG: hypothetical protein ACK5PB_19430 [Pirellula sp.]
MLKFNLRETLALNLHDKLVPRLIDDVDSASSPIPSKAAKVLSHSFSQPPSKLCVDEGALPF